MVDNSVSPQLALKACGSRHKYVRALGEYVLGRTTLAELNAISQVGLMPSQLKLISEIKTLYKLEDLGESS